MSKRIDWTKRAMSDVDGIYAEIRDNRPASAARFLVALAADLEILLTFGDSGSPRATKRASLKGLRLAPIREFPTYSIYYVPVKTGLRIVRVLHGARDASSLLGLI